MTARDESGSGAAPLVSNVASFLNHITLDPAVLLKHHLPNQGSVLAELNYYRQRYQQIDLVLLHYLTPAQKVQERYHLRKMALLYRLQMRHELARRKTENIKSYLAEVAQCEARLDKLDPDWQSLIALEPARNYQVPERPGIYQAFSFAKWLVNYSSYSLSKSKTIQSVMGGVNEYRLYWIWCSLLLKGVLEQIPLQFFNTQQAKKAVAFPDRFTGYLSFGLYYFRFAINFYLTLKHVWHPLMSQEEKESKWYERLVEQLDARKFILLNDFFWATANVLCCFWLDGPKLGSYGDVLTIALLVFDVSMAAWAFAEEKSNHEKELLRLQDKIKRLEETQRNEEKKKNRNAEESCFLFELQTEIAALEDQLAQQELEWTNKKLKLIIDIVYAVGLTLTFVVLTTPFIPLAAATAMSVNLAGAALCFALTVICNVIQGSIDIYNASEAVNRLHNKKNALEGQFINYLQDFTEDSDLSKQLYLEILRCEQDTLAGQQMVTYQQAQLVRKLLIESLMPAVIFVSFVFLPMGVGIGAVGATIGLAMASFYLIEKLKPKEANIAEEFPEGTYKRYVADVLETQPKKAPATQSSLSSSRPLRLFYSSSTGKEDKGSAPVLGNP